MQATAAIAEFSSMFPELSPSAVQNTYQKFRGDSERILEALFALNKEAEEKKKALQEALRQQKEAFERLQPVAQPVPQNPHPTQPPQPGRPAPDLFNELFQLQPQPPQPSQPTAVTPSQTANVLPTIGMNSGAKPQHPHTAQPIRPQSVHSPQPTHPIPSPQPVHTPQPVPSPQPVHTPQPVSSPQPVHTPQPVPSPQPVHSPTVHPSHPVHTPPSHSPSKSHVSSHYPTGTPSSPSTHRVPTSPQQPTAYPGHTTSSSQAYQAYMQHLQQQQQQHQQFLQQQARPKSSYHPYPISPYPPPQASKVPTTPLSPQVPASVAQAPTPVVQKVPSPVLQQAPTPVCNFPPAVKPVDDRSQALEKQLESQAAEIKELRELILKQSQVIQDHKKSLDESKRLVESQATKFAVQNLVNSLKYSIDSGLSGLGELNSIVKKELALSLLQDCDQSGNSPLVVFNPFSSGNGYDASTGEK